MPKYIIIKEKENCCPKDEELRYDCVEESAMAM